MWMPHPWKCQGQVGQGLEHLGMVEGEMGIRQEVGWGSGRRDAATWNSLGMGAVQDWLTCSSQELWKALSSTEMNSPPLVWQWQSPGEHPMATVVGTAAFGGGCSASCCCHIFFLLEGTNYPHPSNISSHFHKQLTSALHHQASEKGVVTHLLKDGRTGCLAYIIKGGLAFQLEFLNRGRISEKITKQKYFTLFWEGFVLGL